MCNKNHYEETVANNLFDHFVDVCHARPLIEKLEKMAEKFLIGLYPRAEASCRGRPKFTFDIHGLKLDGFHGYSKSYGVSRSCFQEVSYESGFPY